MSDNSSDNPIRMARIDKVFLGKTISKVNTNAVNMWQFTFTDGTTQDIYAETDIGTPVGIIPGIFLEEELADGFGGFVNPDTFEEEEENDLDVVVGELFEERNE